jgi:hypothetical protein
MFCVFCAFLERYYASRVAVKLHEDRGVYAVFGWERGNPRKCPDCTVFVQIVCSVPDHSVLVGGIRAFG